MDKGTNQTPDSVSQNNLRRNSDISVGSCELRIVEDEEAAYVNVESLSDEDEKVEISDDDLKRMFAKKDREIAFLQDQIKGLKETVMEQDKKINNLTKSMEKHESFLNKMVERKGSSVLEKVKQLQLKAMKDEGCKSASGSSGDGQATAKKSQDQRGSLPESSTSTWGNSGTGKRAQSIGQRVQSTGHVAQSTGQVAQSTGQVALSIGQRVQSTGQVAQSTGQVALSTAQKAQNTGQVAQSTGQVTQSIGQVTQNTGQRVQNTVQVAQSTGQVAQSIGQRVQNTVQVAQSTGQRVQNTVQVAQSTGQRVQIIGQRVQSTGPREKAAMKGQNQQGQPESSTLTLRNSVPGQMVQSTGQGVQGTLKGHDQRGSQPESSSSTSGDLFSRQGQREPADQRVKHQDQQSQPEFCTSTWGNSGVGQREQAAAKGHNQPVSQLGSSTTTLGSSGSAIEDVGGSRSMDITQAKRKKVVTFGGRIFYEGESSQLQRKWQRNEYVDRRRGSQRWRDGFMHDNRAPTPRQPYTRQAKDPYDLSERPNRNFQARGRGYHRGRGGQTNFRHSSDQNAQGPLNKYRNQSVSVANETSRQLDQNRNSKYHSGRVNEKEDAQPRNGNRDTGNELEDDEEDEIFYCPHCPWKFGERQNMERHCEAMHPIYKCDKCEKEYKFQESLRRHMKSVHGM